jgi:hypothetical protein
MSYYLLQPPIASNFWDIATGEKYVVPAIVDSALAVDICIETANLVVV